MSDPASAIGLAASLVQFLAFASGLLKTSKQIYRSVDGSTDATAKFDIITRSLQELTNEIISEEQNFDLGMGSTRNGTVAEKELLQLSHRCKEVTAELLSALKSLKGKKGIGHWKSFWQALRFVWNENKINALAPKMEQYRRQIDTALLMSIR